MSSKLLINVNDATPTVVPDTSAPDTGMFSVSHTDGVSFNTSMILPIIGIVVLTVAIMVGIIVAVSRRKKVNRFTTHTNKHLVAKLTTLSVVVLLGVLGVMNMDKISKMVSATTETSEDTLTITASDIKIDVDLNDKAVFATGESVVTVDSATESGYTLMAYVDSTTTDLKNETNKSSKSKITMLSSNEPTTLTDNTWGLSTTKPTSQTQAAFTGLPTTQDTAITLKTIEEATTANDKSTFYYGTYITPDLDFGTYSGVTITYIAIANVVDICNPNATTIQEAKCLQDFAGPNRVQIIDSMTPETQYTLIDKRDKKSYTIAKLAMYYGTVPKNSIIDDSSFYSVWMTQNLDLDLDSNTTYTNEDTDLGFNIYTQQYESASWVPSRSTYETTSDQAHEWCSGGEWYTYFHRTDCINYTPESYDPGDYYWSGINGPDAPDDFNWNDYVDEGIISSTSTQQYHLGNYYNWNAAVAMNNTSNISDDEYVDQSICPAGWTIPYAFRNLWYEYGFNASSFDNEGNGLTTDPLYFNMSGFFDGHLSHIALAGFLWTPVTYDDSQAVSPGFQVRWSESMPDGRAYRGLGVSVRCFVRLDGIID